MHRHAWTLSLQSGPHHKASKLRAALHCCSDAVQQSNVRSLAEELHRLTGSTTTSSQPADAAGPSLQPAEASQLQKATGLASQLAGAVSVTARSDSLATQVCTSCAVRSHPCARVLLFTSDLLFRMGLTCSAARPAGPEPVITAVSLTMLPVVQLQRLPPTLLHGKSTLGPAAASRPAQQQINPSRLAGKDTQQAQMDPRAGLSAAVADMSPRTRMAAVLAHQVGHNCTSTQDGSCVRM